VFDLSAPKGDTSPKDKNTMRVTPWGMSDSEKSYDRGLTWVGTPSHGGFLVGKGYARKHLSPAAIAEGAPFGQYLAFEEDCDASIILYELPQTRGDFTFGPEGAEADLLMSLSRWHPAYLAARGIAATAEPFEMPTEMCSAM
jgi:hypothetical protein